MKIAILGYGKEGKSTYSYLLNNGIKSDQIFILDKKNNSKYLENLEQFDIIFKSPGISSYLKELQKVKDKIKTQASVFFEKFKGKIILITGSKGKSTTSKIIYEILKKSGKNVKLIGNIGNPIFSEIDFNNPPNYVVFEISSYMLDGIKPHSDFAILTNIYKVHTSWHLNYDNYVKAKLNVFNDCKTSILRFDLKDYIKNIKFDNIYYFGKGTDCFFDKHNLFSKNYNFGLNDIKLEGDHNYLNIVSILPICENLNISKNVIKSVLQSFSGLEHRQEFVGKVQGIYVYNDSIATIPESVMQAIERFGNSINTIILGGKNDDLNYAKLIKEINKSSIQNIILMPDSFENWKNYFYNKSVFEVDNLKKAVQIVKQKTEKGKICILSPGATSYNMFKNFEERGNIFKNLILNFS